MGFAIAIDFNDLTVGTNDIPGERADALNRTINGFFDETIEDYDLWETIKELEEAE